MTRIRTSGLRFIKLLAENGIPELQAELGNDLQTQEVWNILKMIQIRVGAPDFIPEWRAQHGITRIEMEIGRYISEHRAIITFESEADWAMFKLQYGDLGDGEY